jgi:ABC-type oligopeptide transport system ATPase subunit
VLGQTPVTSGQILFDGEDITNANRSRRQSLGRELQVVFQDPYSSLNPARHHWANTGWPLRGDKSLNRDVVRGKIAEILQRVGMPADTAERYPGQFSGDQRQRIAIARAVIIRPRLIVCDEPVSALDLSVQAQVLNLLNELQQEMNLSMLFVSHDLTVIRHVSHRTVVLYRGEIVEEGDARQINEHPTHPYTQSLLDASPVPDPDLQRAKREARRQRLLITADGVTDKVA